MTDEQIVYRSPSYYEIVNETAVDWRAFRDSRYWEYRRKWDEWPQQCHSGEFPLHVDIDTTNACNLRCTMCPRTHFIAENNKKWAPEGRIGFMDWDLFDSVVRQAAKGGAYSIKINYLGEPLLHPDVIRQVRRAKDLGLLVMMNTNATRLDPVMSEELLRAGIDDIFFSVDSPYAEEYEKIRVGADFYRVIDNIRHFVEIKDRLGLHHVQTRASMVLHFGDADQAKAKEDYKLLFRSLGVAEIGFGLLTDMNTDYRREHGRVPGFICRDPYSRMFVFWDGAIGPCCGEWERGYLLGSAANDQLADVWHNERYRVLRQAHQEGRYDAIGICRRCSVPWLSRQEVSA